jgi:hypothetical protein
MLPSGGHHHRHWPSQTTIRMYLHCFAQYGAAKYGRKDPFMVTDSLYAVYAS